MLEPASKRAAQLGLLGASVMLFGSFAVLLSSQANTVFVPASAERAPLFVVQDTQSNPIRLGDFAGKTVVLFFTSSQEADAIGYEQRVDRLARHYTDDPRVQFLALHSRPQMSESSIREARVQARLLERPFPTAVDPSGAVAQLYNVTSRPQVVVVDASGLIRYSGPFDDHCNEQNVSRQFCADTLRQLLGTPQQIALAQQ
jgi:peroxiredoxin